MSAQGARLYSRIKDATSPYWANLDDLSSLSEEVLSDGELYILPEEDFSATVDLWWSDFLYEAME